MLGRRAVSWLIFTAWSILRIADAISQDDIRGIKQVDRPATVHRMRHGSWGTRQVEVINSTPEDTSVISGGYFTGQPLKRYARKVNLPAKSMRRVQIPALATSSEAGSIEWNSMLLSADAENEVLLHASNEFIVDREVLPQATRSEHAVIADLNPQHIAETQWLTEMIVAIRLATGLNRRHIQIDAADVPAFHRGLDAVDQILLGSSQISDYPAILEALRAWVYRGGQLWVCLDRTGTQVAHDLFGDKVPIYTVDETSLVEFQLDDRRSGKPSGDLLQVDYPVKFVRVEVSEVEVIHKVDGWPASFTCTHGSGRVLFTTIGPRAWIRKRTVNDPAQRREGNSLFLARPSMVDLIDVWHGATEPPPLATAELKAYLARQTGYNIPSGATVLSILSLYCVLLAVVGYWLHARQTDHYTDESVMREEHHRRPEHLALIGTILALGFAVPLIMIGQSSRSAVQAGISTVEVVDVDPHSSEIQCTGVTSIYSPNGDTLDLETIAGRRMQPPEDAASGTVRRTMWTDLGTTMMDGLQIPAGLQFFQSRQKNGLNGPREAVIRFGPEGIEGNFRSECFVSPQDAVIAGPTEHILGVTFQNDGTFSADIGTTLEPGSYISAPLLSDEQSLRQDVYRAVLRQTNASRYPSELRLLAWTRRTDTDLTAIAGYQSSHTSIVAIPLRVIRPANGTDVVIPSPFMKLEVLSSQDGGTTSAYNPRSRQWLESTAPTHLRLRFGVPKVLAPLDVSRLNLEIRIAAPGRRVKIAAGPQDDRREIVELNSPSGTYNYVIDDPDRLSLDMAGRYHMDVNVAAAVTEPEGRIRSTDPIWKMDFIRLEVLGRTTGSPFETASKKEVLLE